MYSTPSIYLDYVHQADESWTIKTDDFFPYADHPFSFWTGTIVLYCLYISIYKASFCSIVFYFEGYFSSRPGLKGYVRKCNNHLQACKQLEAIHNGFPSNKPSSMALSEYYYDFHILSSQYILVPVMYKAFKGPVDSYYQQLLVY